MTDHVYEFNSFLSGLMSIDIKFKDEVMALLLLSSFPHSWLGIVLVVISSVGGAKLAFEGILNLILGEDVRRQSAREAFNSFRSIKDRGRGPSEDVGAVEDRSRE